ncbi:hypothetical protein B0I37DRAFT_430319 [Chaetomium sp. MPI-CAGE-AT-0009]|nr:hypothetical protein B0I37DRAFT_430319 [Chaetomium sp. MPI-CAGE-AT-0009]
MRATGGGVLRTILLLLARNADMLSRRERGLPYGKLMLRYAVLQSRGHLHRQQMCLATFYDFCSETEEPEACTVEVDKRAVLPTKTIPYKETYTTLPGSNTKVCLDNRELMNSMCQGIEKARECVSNSMRLTYRPDLAKTNRPKMCPDGFCAPANVPCAPGDSSGPCNPYDHFVDIPAGRKGVKWRQTCDEFPFARSLQGGEGTSICIPGWQNSFQGFMLRGLRQDVGAGNDYVVELTGWDCKTGRPTEGSAQNCGLNSGSAIKRDDLGGESLTQGNDMTPSGENALMIFIGDVNPGSYTIHLTLTTGTLTSVHALDSDGTPIEASVSGGGGGDSSSSETSLQASPSPYTITLRATEPAYDVSLWALTREERVEVAYNLSYQAVVPSMAGPGPGRFDFVGVGGGGVVGAGVLAGVVGGLLLL